MNPKRTVTRVKLGEKVGVLPAAVAFKLEILLSEIRAASGGNAVHLALLLSCVNEKIAVEAASIQANNSPTELNAYGAGAQVYKDPFSHRGK